MAKVQEEQREKVINGITDLLRTHGFTFEYKVVKKPKGIKVIFEVTQEQMNEIVKGMTK